MAQVLLWTEPDPARVCMLSPRLNIMVSEDRAFEDHSVRRKKESRPSWPDCPHKEARERVHLQSLLFPHVPPSSLCREKVMKKAAICKPGAALIVITHVPVVKPPRGLHVVNVPQSVRKTFTLRKRKSKVQSH